MIKEKINMWKLVSSEEILELSLLVSLTSRWVSDLKTCSKDDLLVRIMWTTDFQMKNWGKLVPIKWYENIQVKIPRFGACEILQQMCQPTLNGKRNQLHFGWLPGQPVTFLWTISSIFYRVQWYLRRRSPVPNSAVSWQISTTSSSPYVLSNHARRNYF